MKKRTGNILLALTLGGVAVYAGLKIRQAMLSKTKTETFTLKEPRLKMTPDSISYRTNGALLTIPNIFSVLFPKEQAEIDTDPQIAENTRTLYDKIFG